MPSLLSRYLPQILVAIAILGAVWTFSNARYEAGYRAAEAAMAQKVAKANEATRQAEIESRKRVEAVDREYQTQLQDLDAKYRDAASRIGPVRVCPSARRSEVPRAAEPASSDHAATGGDGLPEASGNDIGPELVELARLADKQTQQLIACQSYAASLAK